MLNNVISLYSDCNGVPINQDLSQTFASISQSGVPNINPPATKQPVSGVLNGTKPAGGSKGNRLYKSEKEVVCQVLPQLESPGKTNGFKNTENLRKNVIVENDAVECNSCENAREYNSKNCEIPTVDFNLKELKEEPAHSHVGRVHSHNDGYQIYQKNRSSSYLSR